VKKILLLMIFVLSAMLVAPVSAEDMPGGNAPSSPSAQAQSAAQSGSDYATWSLVGLVAIGLIGTAVFYAIQYRKSKAKLVKLEEERTSSLAGETARMATILLSSLVALITFLLVVGVQNTINGFKTELYAAVILLGLCLIIYAVGATVRETALRGRPKAIYALKMLREMQQLVFVGSVIALIWFVLSYVQLVIPPPAAPQSSVESQPQTNQQSPSPQQPPSQPQAQPSQ